MIELKLYTATESYALAVEPLAPLEVQQHDSPEALSFWVNHYSTYMIAPTRKQLAEWLESGRLLVLDNDRYTATQLDVLKVCPLEALRAIEPTADKHTMAVETAKTEAAEIALEIKQNEPMP